MQLHGRLRATTLGDLLGEAHRARATGTLELVEEGRGRVHRVHLQAGRVTAVELDGASRRLADVLRDEGVIDAMTAQRSVLRAMASRRMLGEVLVRDFAVSKAVVGSALRKQLVLRLAALDGLSDARVSFHVTTPAPREALTEAPLEPREFLVGRRRARDRAGSREGAASTRAGACRVLGVDEGADASEIRRAFRRLARTLHPDLHPGVSLDQRKALEAQLVRVTAAYQSLCA